MSYKRRVRPMQSAMFSMSEDSMRGRIQNLLGSSAGHVIDVYRKANPGATPADLYFLIASDNRYGAPVMKIAERRAALGKAPVYLYYFRWESPVDGGRLKSPRTIEIPFAFDNIKASRLTSGSPEAPALADKVSDAWIAFEYAEAAALACVRPDEPPHDGVQQRKRGPERSHSGSADCDVRRDEADVR